MTRPDFEGDEAGRCGGCGSRNLFTVCAFRKGSPERADPWRWMQVKETVPGDVPFHCHKGLKMHFNRDDLTATFDPPDATTGRVTVCAGWLASRIAHFRKQGVTE